MGEAEIVSLPLSSGHVTLRTYTYIYRFRPTWSYVENWYGPQNPYIYYSYNVEDCGNWYKSTVGFTMVA
jgi:hypothetical protein